MRVLLQRACLLFLTANVCSCSPRPAAIRTFEPIDLEGVKELPSFAMDCEGYVILPSLPVNVEVDVTDDTIEMYGVTFQLRDAKSHVVGLKVKYSASEVLVRMDSQGKKRLIAEDIFHSTISGRLDANYLPVGCYYIEAVVGTESNENIIARSKLFCVGN